MGKNSIVVAISFTPPEILKGARDRAKQLGFKNSFSAYVTKLVENDLDKYYVIQDAPASSAKADQAAGEIVSGGVRDARASNSEAQTPIRPTKYSIPRRTKKQPPTAKQTGDSA